MPEEKKKIPKQDNSTGTGCGSRAEMSLEMAAPYISVPGSKFKFCSQYQLTTSVYPGKQQMMAQIPEFLPALGISGLSCSVLTLV